MLASAFVAKAEGERFEEFRRVYENNGLENDSVTMFLEQWAKDATDSLKHKESDLLEGTKYYKILWRADEDVFVELLQDDERRKTSFFSNPGYFHDK